MIFSIGAPLTSVTLSLTRKTSNSAVLSWNLDAKLPDKIQFRALFWVTFPSGEIRFFLVALKAKTTALTDLVPYANYKVQITIGPKKVPGINKHLSSNELTFKTLPASKCVLVH